MKKFPIYINYETSDYGCHEFDPQVDFTLFLEEARQHARAVKVQHSSLPNSEEAGKRGMAEGMKSKNSWKKSLFKWWKADKKVKPGVLVRSSSHNNFNSIRDHVSGPIHRNGSGVDNKMHRRATSGPLASLFKPSKRVEDGISYMCLDQVDISSNVKTYGPVYLVT